MRRLQPVLLGAILATLALGACAGNPGPDTCTIKMVGPEGTKTQRDGVDVAYRVKGYAGSRGTVWLAAKLRSGEYLSGPGVEVGPGPFEAIVELSLTGIPPSFVAVLDIGSKRCKT